MYYLIIILSFISFIFNSPIGGYPGSAFNYGVNAKEIGLSGATLCNNSIGFRSFSNPALLSKIKSNEYGLSFFSMSLDRYVQALSVSIPLEGAAGISLSYTRVGTDKIPLKDLNNFENGFYDHNESYASISFGNNIGKLSIGITAKVFFNNLVDDYSGDGVGADIGFLYEINDRINLGSSFKNLGAKYVWETKDDRNIYEEDFPSIYSYGLSYNNNIVLLLIQYDKSQLDDVSFDELKLGFEINLEKSIGREFFVRIGGKKSNAYTLGFGLPININENFKLVFDYAVDPGSVDQGISHLMSFSISRDKK